MARGFRLEALEASDLRLSPDLLPEHLMDRLLPLPLPQKRLLLTLLLLRKPLSVANSALIGPFVGCDSLQNTRGSGAKTGCGRSGTNVINPSSSRPKYIRRPGVPPLYFQSLPPARGMSERLNRVFQTAGTRHGGYLSSLHSTVWTAPRKTHIGVVLSRRKMMM